MVWRVFALIDSKLYLNLNIAAMLKVKYKSVLLKMQSILLLEILQKFYWLYNSFSTWTFLVKEMFLLYFKLDLKSICFSPYNIIRFEIRELK